MQHLLIRNARLSGDDEDAPLKSVLIAGDRIVGIGTELQPPLVNTMDYDAHGHSVLPALVSLCEPLPEPADEAAVADFSFAHLTAGICTIGTAAEDVDDNISWMATLPLPTVNYTVHVALRQLTAGESKRLRKLMILRGIATATVRLGDERKNDIPSLAHHITTARLMGLRVLYDFRGLVEPGQRIDKMQQLCDLLQKEVGNRAYFIGVENREELELLQRLRSHCDTLAHLCYDPFGQPDSELTKLTAEELAGSLRQGHWCSLGLAYSASKALREGWPDMTPEIVGRNQLPILMAMPCARGLSLAEVEEFTMSRPAEFVGLSPQLGRVKEGSLANLLIWNPDHHEQARIDTPRGNIQTLKLDGYVEAVVQGGRVVVDEKMHQDLVCGQQYYARLL